MTPTLPALPSDPADRAGLRPFAHVSASQITAYRDCSRLWYFQTIMGIRGPDKPSALLGTQVHGVLEKYLSGTETRSGPVPGSGPGSGPDAGLLPPSVPIPLDTVHGRIAAAGIPHLPAPGTAQIEVQMETHNPLSSDYKPGGPVVQLALAGIPVHGYIDVLRVPTPTYAFDPARSTLDPILVLDHKTAGDERFIKTEEDLKYDPQMMIYGKFAFEYADAIGRPNPKVTLRHVVYFTKGLPRSKPTEITRFREHVESQFANLAGSVVNMKIIADSAVRPSEVEPNWGSCNKFGGCYFRDKCRAIGGTGSGLRLFQDPATVSHTQPEPKTGVIPMSAALAALAKRKAELNAAAGTAPPATGQLPLAAPAQTPTPPPPAVSAPVPAAPAAPTAQSALLAKLKAAASAPVAAVGQAINPPDAPPNLIPGSPEDLKLRAEASQKMAEQAKEDAEVAAATGGTVRRPQKYKEKLGLLGYPDAKIESMTPAEMRAAIEGSVPYLGEPIEIAPMSAERRALIDAPASKSPVELAMADLFQAQWRGAPDDVKAFIRSMVGIADGAATGDDAEYVEDPNALVLYIDCYPERDNTVQHMDEILVPYQQAVAKHNGVSHYSLLPFQQGQAGLAAHMLEHRPRGKVYVNSRYPASNAVLEVLCPMATKIVRGR